MKLSKHTVYLLKMFFIIFITNCFCFLFTFEYKFFGDSGVFDRQNYAISLGDGNDYPFDRFITKIKYVYSYYFSTYFVASVGHVYLYNQLWFSAIKLSKWLKITKYILGMYLVAVFIYTINHNLGKASYVFYLESFLVILFFAYFVIKPALFFFISAWVVTFFLKKPVVENI